MRRALSMVVLVAGLAGVTEGEIVQPPAPTGPYGVGTVARHLVDTARLEAFTEAADDHRELMIQFWYPADGTAGKETTPYLPANAAIRRAVFGQLMMPPAKVDETMGAWRTRAVEGAPIAKADERYPVVLFSHGFGGIRGQNSSQMEELASRGYVVVAIDHTFCAAAVEFPDGRLVELAAEFKTREPNPDLDAVDKRFDELARLWAADSSFVIDELGRINVAADDVFAGRLDLDRIGMFGHSFGGATSAQMCLRDARVRCGINMDGRAYGDSRFEGVTRPFLVLCAVRGEPDPSLLAISQMTKEQYTKMIDTMMAEFDLLLRAAPEGYLAAFTHMDHYNFTDVPYFSELTPMRRIIVGDIDPARGGKMINDYVLSFFGKYLKDEPAPLLAADASHEPEVAFTAHRK